MDFNNLDGYMFEELIVKLFKRMGFLVEQTALSGDGGIDIIAYNDQPVYKGKYLIQCKNWNNVVGQPEVRDLFGVVMSENANKGILIATSHFTEQAKQFADNKNIELIEYDVLMKLLCDYGLLEGNKSYQSIKKHFTDFNDFDKTKYIYLKSKVENNRTEKLYYDNLKEFYHQYIISNNYEINTTGLIDEYINLNNEIIKRFCKKSKEKIAEGETYKYINGYLYLLKGHIFKSIEIYKDLGIFEVNPNVDITPSSYDTIIAVYQADLDRGMSRMNQPELVRSYNYSHIFKVRSCKSPLVIIKNLYLLFNKMAFIEGENYLEAIIDRNYESIPNNRYFDWAEEMNRLKLQEAEKTFHEIKNNNYDKVHLPTKMAVDKKSNKEYEIYAYYDDDKFVSIDDLITLYYKDLQDKIVSELDKSKIILDINEA